MKSLNEVDTVIRDAAWEIDQLIDLSWNQKRNITALLYKIFYTGVSFEKDNIAINMNLREDKPNVSEM